MNNRDKLSIIWIPLDEDPEPPTKFDPGSVAEGELRLGGKGGGKSDGIAALLDEIVRTGRDLRIVFPSELKFPPQRATVEGLDGRIDGDIARTQGLIDQVRQRCVMPVKSDEEIRRIFGWGTEPGG